MAHLRLLKGAVSTQRGGGHYFDRFISAKRTSRIIIRGGKKTAPLEEKKERWVCQVTIVPGVHAEVPIYGTSGAVFGPG